MRTWAAGSRQRRHPAARGFTLLELLVVITIIALASAGVAFALRDTGSTQLEREAQRLAALLDTARALSRASGTPVRWMPTPQGFRFEGLRPQALPEHWLDSSTTATLAVPLLLGPEPIIGPQRVLLRLSDRAGPALEVRSDGLGPFEVRAGDPVPPTP